MLPFDKIAELADELDSLPDGGTLYLNRKTYDNFLLHDDFSELQQPDADLESMPDWMREDYVTVQNILNGDDWIALPDKFDLNEWAIMQEFASECETESLRHELQNAIHGSGAFRRFKQLVNRRNIQQAWYDFKKQALIEFVMEWLDANEIAYSKATPSTDTQ